MSLLNQAAAQEEANCVSNATRSGNSLAQNTSVPRPVSRIQNIEVELMRAQEMILQLSKEVADELQNIKNHLSL